MSLTIPVYRKAKTEHGASIVFLPEAFDFIGESGAQTKELAEPLDGPTVSKYQQLAKELDLEVSLGGFHEATTGLKSTTQIPYSASFWPSSQVFLYVWCRFKLNSYK